jgi:hypothetical protein
MAVNPKRFALAQLGNADAAIVTGSNNVTTLIKRAVFTNTSASAVTLTINVVPNAGSSSAANRVIDPQRRTLAAGESYVSPELAGTVLSSGDMIRGLASTASVVTAMVSGVEIS